ncbi:MAG: glycosyltransferase [Gammaproteobacteria bacterium]|nr:glycosyltransferase [Gammaproteobacteria bacterium]
MPRNENIHNRVESSPTAPCLSVVIATYNRCDVLKETLRRLDRQTLAHDRFEVIVVDDGSPDATAATVNAIAKSVSFPLRYLHHENRGPGYTENIGIKAAKHELLLLIADDIWSHPNLLTEHIDYHLKYPQSKFGVLGSVSQSSDLSKTVLHNYWDPFQFDRFEHGQEVDGVYFHACNISVKRDFLINNGLFLERKGAAHEDIELGYRLACKGLRLIYNKNASAVHHHAETLDGICARAFERGRNFDLLLNSLPPAFALPLYKIFSPEAGFRQLFRMFPRELMRLSLFNSFSVRYFWRPTLTAAENGGLARLAASQLAYRGIAGHYLRAGFREMKKQRKLTT